MTEPLPGNPTPREGLERAIRAGHAAEHAAMRVCQGQLAVLGGTERGEALRRRLGRERNHRDALAAVLADRRVRPTALLPLWHLAGFALGAASAALGARAAAACAAAVEAALDEQHAEHAAMLADGDAVVAATAERFGGAQDAAPAAGEDPASPAIRVLGQAVKSGWRLAMGASRRL